MEGETHFCRLCLSASVVYYSLLKNNGKEMVLSLTGIKISDDDPYSTESCAKCWLDLKLAYYIQQCFVEAEKKIQKMSTHSQTKIEVKNIKVEGASTEEITIETIKIENIDIEYKEEIEFDSQEEDDNVSDDDTEYPELIYIETDENVVEGQPVICFICGEECNNETRLYAHINTHYNEPQLCAVCSESLPNIPAYRNHIQLTHPEMFGKTYICGICSATFKYMSLYNLHLEAAHPAKAKRNKRRKAVDLGKPEADNDTDIIYKCEECNKTFTSKKTCNAHIENHIKKVCPICGIEITSPNLRNHIKRHKTSPVVCDICGITCKHLSSLQWHKAYTHAKKRLKCEECGQEFRKLYLYNVHLKKHAGDKSFTCDTCGKGFFTQHRLNIHVKTTHLKERPHICKFCGQAYAKRENMRIHERKHTNEEPYVCDVCGVGFRQNVSLRGHKRSKHHIFEDKNVVCPICNKMFKDDWALQSHTRSQHD